MKKQYTSAEVFTTENFNNPFGDNHHSPTYNLSEHFKSIFSQHGEDGILEYLYSIIDIKKKYYVEFGASNGNTIENTRSLRENHPPRHDFNSFSFKNITHLDKKLDTEFFYELGRAGYF